ncbi:MAG: hypothetical protein LM577_03515 [Thermoproteaceae archaeon]|nr:hypothetical protein [Thermoproteaceae archaeon]
MAYTSARGVRIDADLNASRSIAKRAGYVEPVPKLSYVVTAHGIRPLTPAVEAPPL